MGVFSSRDVVSKTLFLLIAAFLIFTSLLYVHNIFNWRNYPDFGWGYRVASGFNVLADITENGRRAGMQLGDRILEINGKIFSNFEELRAGMHRELGDVNTYLMKRGESEVLITITNIPSGLKKSFSTSGLSYLLGFCYFLIGTLVFLMKPHRRSSWIFLLYTSIFGILLIFVERVGKMTPFWLESFEIFAFTFTPATLIHLALSFPKERRLLAKYPYSQLVPYLLSVLLFLCIRYATPTMGDAPKTLLIITVIYMVVGVFFFIGSCLQLRLTSSSEIVKLRSRVILLAFAIMASLPLSDFVVNALFQVYIVPSARYYLPFFIIFPLAIGYSIVKHDLFDIDAIIKRTYGYLLTTGALAGIYGVIVLVSNLAFGRFEITKSRMFPLIFILAVVFFFNPIRNRVQRLIDRLFYRLEYDYQETVQKISETMRTLLGLNEIGKSMMDTALGVMFIDSGSVMLLNKQEQAYEYLIRAGQREERRAGTEAESTIPGEKAEEKGEIREVEIEGKEEEVPKPREESEAALRLSEVKLPADDPLIQKIAQRKKEVTIYDIQEDPFFEAEKESCKRAFDQMEATLIVPLIYEDRLSGLISLGDKKSGKFYRREDINLLNTLANQGAVAIENALMIEEVIEKERMEEELSIAKDLQTSMLPATCPEIEGFEIAAVSIPAREVGGDFFDFIEMGKGRLGFVIGDVTGKSVSGALVMSASRSVFRMLSEVELTVDEIMIRANRRTKKDIKSGMFVALLYAVLDAKDRTLSLCSAGQTQPIQLYAETGEASLVETKGDTFPLGILEDAEYQETRLQLAPGDKVVFYTDGIVEAMNEKEEIFGFERLLEVVQGGRSMSADSLLKEITDKVNEFAGGAAQHDDLTVIVLSVTE